MAVEQHVPPAARRRATCALAALAGGYLAARTLPGVAGAAWMSVACAGLALALVLRGRRCAAAMVVAAAAAGAGWFALRVLERPGDSLARWLDAGPALLRVEGVVLTAPRASEPAPGAGRFFDEPRTCFDLRVERAIDESGAGAPAAGILRVRVAGLGAGGSAGDRVRVTGTASPLAAPANPGERDARLLGAQEGRVGTMRTPGTELVERLRPRRTARASVERAWLELRALLRARAETLLLGSSAEPSHGRALLAALILGLREPGLEEVQPAFTRLGLAHVLAISGFHLVVMAGVAMTLVRCAGDLGRAEPLIVSLLVGAYLMVVPPEAPVMRSGLMVLGVLGAGAAGRRYDRLTMLAWIGVALLLWRPMDLWSMGMQLSFGLVAALLWMGPRTHARLWGVRIRTDLPRRRRVWEPALDAARAGLSASLLCWAVATPAVIHHTGMFSPLAVVGTLVVVPLTVALLWGAYAALIAGAVVPAAAAAAGPALGAIAAATAWLVGTLDDVPGMWVRLPSVSWVWALSATAMVVYWFVRGYWRDTWAWGATAGLLVWLGVEVVAGPRLPGAVPLRVDTLAVGDGACHLLRSGRAAMLWDCGSSSPGAGRLMIPRAARELGAWRVREAVVTHPNVDHYGALADAAPLIGLERLYVGAAFLREGERSALVGAALERLRGLGVEVREIGAGETLRLGAATLEVLSPPADAAWPELNNHSLVAMVRVPTAAGERRVLMTGDIQAEAMGSLLSRHARLSAHVLELPHHGSAHEAAYSFVADVDPAVVLQSTGPSRAGDARWDHARPGRAWRTTASGGAAWVEVRRDGTVGHGSLR